MTTKVHIAELSAGNIRNETVGLTVLK